MVARLRCFVNAINQTNHMRHFIPDTNPTRAPLVLLCGSGGDEHDLVSLTQELAPGPPILGIRGTVAIDGVHAFFHLFPARTTDKVDITARIPLADFIGDAGACYGFTRAPVAIGFSNGAIISAALLLTLPSLLAGAVPLRPLSPFTHYLPTRLDGTAVLVLDGENDRPPIAG